MWVVKLGGSLWDSPCLEQWLVQIARSQRPERPLLVVPGGGPFADQVRLAQARLRFDDRAAHRMALLAMEQMAHMFAGLAAGLVPAASIAEIKAAQETGRVPVWLPTHMAMDESRIPASWAVTSDSLAAWLAERVHARGLLLVKSAPLENASLRIPELQADGLLDQAFHRYGAGVRRPVWILSREQWDQLPLLLADEAAQGMRLAS